MNNQILFQRYQILKKLGEGGFGTTYLAEDLQMPSHRRCVVKQLKPLNNEPQIYELIKERFQKEAAILEELGSQNRQIPQLYAYFEDQGQFYLVQEYIDGETLSSLMEQKGSLDENTVKEILVKLLPVLEYVHNHRIVHRDIKPDNIILRRSDNCPILIDFGAVKESMGTMMTPTGTPTSSIVIGTPGFMSSEQSAGRPVYSTDLYALGLTAIYLLTGKLPQDLETDPLSGEVVWKVYAPRLSLPLAEVLDKAVKSFHRERFPTARAMLEALEFSKTPTVVVSPAVTQVASVPSSGVNWLKILFIGGIIALPLVLGFYYWQTRDPKREQIAETTPDPSPSMADETTSDPVTPLPSTAQNQFELSNFPLSSCGDALPSDSSSYPLNVYPIFIEFSPQNLDTIKNNFCQDAFEKTRKDTGELAIQIASFYDVKKAQEFKEFITQKLGNGEVGEPTLLVAPPGQFTDKQDLGEEQIPDNQQSFPESSPQSLQEQNLDENQARETVENFYNLISSKNYEEAKQLFEANSNLSFQFDPQFFDQFSQVNINNLQIISRTDSMINFEGTNTFIYPDGSTQEELRSFVVSDINGEPKITSSQFIKVIKFK